MQGKVTDMTPEFGQDFAHRFDLEHVPYTTYGSRLFVRRAEDGLTVHRAALDQPSIVASGLRVVGPDGEAAVAEAGPHCITFSGGARLFVTADDAVAVELPQGFRVEATWVDGVRLLTDADEVADAVDEVTEDLREWLAKCPEVDEELREATRFSWWVLGANTLTWDAPMGLNRAVVPSKLDHIGLGQWGAYSAAIGLRHGDLNLAVEQLKIALEYQGEDGRLPGVVHEEGTQEAQLQPPLSAVALHFLEQKADSGLVDECLPGVLKAQDWWYSTPAPSGRPDLISYLTLSDNLLANWLWERGDHEARARCQGRAEAAVDALSAMWDADAGYVRSLDEHGSPVPSETIATLMPLIVDGLPEEMVAGLVEAIKDPQRFGTPYPLPTTAVRDRGYTHTEPWQGPVSVNTNWLVATALRARGLLNLAEPLERATVNLVADHGANEFYRPDTGERPTAAHALFSPAAALAVDLAVRLTAARQGHQSI